MFSGRDAVDQFRCWYRGGVNCNLGLTVLPTDQKGCPATCLRSKQLQWVVTIGVIFPEICFSQDINSCGALKLTDTYPFDFPSSQLYPYVYNWF